MTAEMHQNIVKINRIAEETAAASDTVEGEQRSPRCSRPSSQDNIVALQGLNDDIILDPTGCPLLNLPVGRIVLSALIECFNLGE